MDTPKKYKIETIQDIFKIITTENVEAFIKDFASWARLTVEKKEEIEKLNIEGLTLQESRFTWVDDGKNDLLSVKTKIRVQIDLNEEQGEKKQSN